jgi:hypothetical protein
MTFNTIAQSGWRNSAAVRVIASALSWFLFALGFTVLLNAVFGVMAIGGNCASGGPYVIAHECPDNTAFAPLGILGGVLAVGISIYLAQGFGTPLVTWAWPILFGVLGGLFVSSGELVGFIIGGLFLIMAVIPLIIEVRASPQRVFVGQFSASGNQFFEGDRARKSFSSSSPISDGQRPTALNWLASLAIALLFGFAGVALASYWMAGPA